jgi:putative heme-binding domain-containing protein
LGHPDRFVRYAARTAIEHRPRKEWERRALAETNPQAAITAIIALARKVPRKYKPTGSDFDTPPPSYPTDGTLRHGLQPAVLAALGRVDWASLTAEQRLDLLRGYELALYRLGPPDEAAREELIARLDPIYPTGDRRMDVMLTEIMCYLQAPSAAAKGTMLLSHAATKEGQLDLVRSLQHLKTGWTIDLHRNLFKWFAQARDYRGGVSFATYIKELHAKCLANTSAENQAALAEIINAKPSAETNVGSTEARPVVKEWTMEELVPLVETKLTGRNFARGRSVFATAKCFACHYYAGEGGAVGPDLTGLAGRFSSRDILESVLEPNKTISDQYSAWIIVTMSGKTIVGRITKYKGEEIVINTNMEDPNDIKSVKRGEIESMERSDISMMPEGLLNTLHEEEVLDLIAFLLSRGDAKNPMFTKEAKPTAGVAAAAVKSVSRGGDAGEGN